MQIKIKDKRNVRTIAVDHITEYAGIKYAQRVEYPNIRTFVKLPKSTWQEVKK